MECSKTCLVYIQYKRGGISINYIILGGYVKQRRQIFTLRVPTSALSTSVQRRKFPIDHYGCSLYSVVGIPTSFENSQGFKINLKIFKIIIDVD